ncbi:MAG: SDR family oxidoreductase [Planctomycetales bacterium]
MKTFRGKQALVTGAASGIGRSLALALAREGARLHLVDIDEAGLAAVVAEARAFGVEAVGARCDLSRAEDVDHMLDGLLARWGGVDLLVNNAGVCYYGPTDKMPIEQWRWLMELNLMAPVRITGRLLPALLDRPDPHVLNVCSVAGLVAGGRSAAYQTSKFGLVGYTEALRAEFGRRGLGVTALCPGPVRTNLYRAGVSGRKDRAVPEPPRWISTTPDRVARIALKAIRRNRRLVLITPLAHLLWNLKKFAPWLIDFANHLGRKKRRLAAHDAPPRNRREAA